MPGEFSHARPLYSHKGFHPSVFPLSRKNTTLSRWEEKRSRSFIPRFNTRLTRQFASKEGGSFNRRRRLICHRHRYPSTRNFVADDSCGLIDLDHRHFYLDLPQDRLIDPLIFNDRPSLISGFFGN